MAQEKGGEWNHDRSMKTEQMRGEKGKERKKEAHTIPYHTRRTDGEGERSQTRGVERDPRVCLFCGFWFCCVCLKGCMRVKQKVKGMEKGSGESKTMKVKRD